MRNSVKLGLVALMFGMISVFGLALEANAILSSNQNLYHVSEYDGAPSDDESEYPDVSGNGRYVVFNSEAENWDFFDNTGGASDDIFRKDLHTGEVILISNAGTREAPMNPSSSSRRPAINYDGSVIAFQSSYDSYVDGDTNGDTDIFVYDVSANTYERVSVGGSAESPIEADNSSYSPRLSDDGRYVAFRSDATNLVAGDTNGESDAFVFDRQTHTLERVSVDGTQVSPVEIACGTFDIDISGDGNVVAFTNSCDSLAEDTNTYISVYAFDRSSHTLELVSKGGTSGSPSYFDDEAENPSLSYDGRYVAFDTFSDALDPVGAHVGRDVFRFDRQTHSLEIASVAGTKAIPIYADDTSEGPSIDSSGRYVTYVTGSTTFDSNDTNGEDDIYVTDLDTNTTTFVSHAGTDASPVLGNDDSDYPRISANGCAIVFDTEADNFVAADGNGDDEDIYATSGPVDCSDNDGVESSVEDAAPNDGDANGDSIADSEQFNVTSLVSPVSGEYITLEAGGVCSSNDSVVVTGESSVESKDDDQYEYPTGLIDFSLTGCSIGGSETITQYYYGDFDIDSVVLRKYDASDDSYETIEDAVLTQVTIGGEQAIQAVYTVVDGGELDADGVANGVIVDPVGIGVLADSTPGAPDTGLAFVSSTPIIASLIAGVAILSTGVYAHKRKV